MNFFTFYCVISIPIFKESYDGWANVLVNLNLIRDDLRIEIGQSSDRILLYFHFIAIVHFLDPLSPIHHKLQGDDKVNEYS